GIRFRYNNPVSINVSTLSQLRDEINNTYSPTKRDIRSPLIQSDHQHFCRSRSHRHFSKTKHRCQRRLGITPRYTGQSGHNSGSKSTRDDLFLEIPELHRLPSAMTARHTQIIVNKTNATIGAVAWITLER